MTNTPNSFVDSLRQHRLFRVATIYAIVGWLLIQFADICLEAFESPPWIMQAFLVIVLAGFPITVTCIWLLARKNSDGPSKAVVPILTIIVAVLLSFGAYHYFANNQAKQNPTSAISQQVRTSNPVLAVLPFANMSSDAENEYLADGITEDVITLLAQSPGMEVIARNSTFKYKNQNPDIRDVGRDLGAEYVIEGSIRPFGDRIRVTVQVIETATGAHIWAEKYDRPLAEFFEVQDEVSLGVAAAVGDAVFREGYQRASQSRTEKLTAWAATSRANVNFNLNMLDELAVESARQAVALDPDYALAHAVLGRVLAIQSLADVDNHAGAEEAEAEARLAARLAPDDPRVQAYLAVSLLWTGQPVEALAIGERVPKMSPSYAEGLMYYGDILIHNGRSQDAIPYLEKGIKLTPSAPQLGFYLFLLGEGLMHQGNFVAAEEPLIAANRLFSRENSLALVHLAGTQLQLGKVEEAKANLKLADPSLGSFINDAQRIMEFYSTDGGGEYFKSVWAGLEALAATLEN
jgi:TolB-like protein/Flp pilus assembly protein TadD